MIATGIQAGFNGELIGARVLKQIKEHGFLIVRVDLTNVIDEAAREAAVQEVQDAGLRPLAIVAHPEQVEVLPLNIDIEFGNEPDLDSVAWDMAKYADRVVEMIEATADPVNGWRLWVGAISNLNGRGFEFLRRLPWDEIPEHVGVTVHRYPPGRSPIEPHRGFQSRAEEIARLRQVIGTRPWAVSEVGYHTGDRGKVLGLFPRRRMTEEDVAAAMDWERRFFQGVGAQFVVAYQLNDGRTNDGIDRYGFRRRNGDWKLVATAFASPWLLGQDVVR